MIASRIQSWQATILINVFLFGLFNFRVPYDSCFFILLLAIWTNDFKEFRVLPKSLPGDHLLTHLVGIHHFHSRLLVWRASAHELAEVSSIPASTLRVGVSQCSIELCRKLYVDMHHNIVHPSRYAPGVRRSHGTMLEMITVFCQWSAPTYGRGAAECAKPFCLQHHPGIIGA